MKYPLGDKWFKYMRITKSTFVMESLTAAGFSDITRVVAEMDPDPGLDQIPALNTATCTVKN